MAKGWHRFFGQTVLSWCRGLMLVMFIPVLFCVLAIGNKMGYWDAIKLKQLLYSTQTLGILAILGAAVCLGVLYLCRNISLDRRGNQITNIVLVGAFLGVFFLNLMVTREIAYKLPSDMMVVRGCGYYAGTEKPLGYYSYLSIYPNNIPISYFLGRIYRTVLQQGDFPYVIDYAWMQVGCALVSLAGFFSCLTVKKLTRRLMPVIICFLAAFLLVECSAWKMVPYTDTYAVAFSIMSVYFYLLSRDSDNKNIGKFSEGRRYALLIVSLACAGMGGLMKPSVYIVLVAVVGIEFCRLLGGDGKRLWLYLALDVLLLIAMMYGIGKYREHMIAYLGLEYNKEVSASWQHYFLMGLNDSTTGGYNPEDSAIFGEFQYEKRAVRNQAELERAVKRLKEKGVLGVWHFYLKKLTMSFNDATFGWGTEVWVDSYYEGENNLASGTDRTEALRSIYWNGKWTGAYYTVCQLVWYVILVGIPGICLVKRRTDGFDILVVSCLGILFYQMLFEARARYLFVFAPLLIAASICGYMRYASLLESIILKRKRDALTD
ncbi:MAG: hypothetical protein NC543_11860 [bacterium]|nr:hypothetical protein [bacterium]MCM1376056.1 hypothetical protein [Muribaculum sp.]